MTRKDYVAIAAAIKDAGTMAHDKVARLMLKACGVQS